MNVSNPTIQAPIAPKLWDYALAEFQTKLEANLSWLTTAYGRGYEHMKRDKNNRQYTFPAVWANNKEYVSMFPDEHLGNYSWFDLSPVQELADSRYEYQRLFANMGIVFWLDLRTAYPIDYTQRTIEHAKSDVMTALRSIFLTRSSFTISRIAETAPNIYRGYTHREVGRQFLMFPYAGFRIEGDIKINEQCPSQGVGFDTIQNGLQVYG